MDNAYEGGAGKDTNPNLADLFDRVRKGMYPSWDDFRKRTGRGEASVRQWATGRRTPTPSVMRYVARYLRDRAEVLLRLADEIEVVAPRIAEQKKARRVHERRGNLG